MKIHISSSCQDALSVFGDEFVIVKRGDIPIKGKGTMTTYWLLGRGGQARPTTAINQELDAVLTV